MYIKVKPSIGTSLDHTVITSEFVEKTYSSLVPEDTEVVIDKTVNTLVLDADNELEVTLTTSFGQTVTLVTRYLAFTNNPCSVSYKTLKDTVVRLGLGLLAGSIVPPPNLNITLLPGGEDPEDYSPSEGKTSIVTLNRYAYEDTDFEMRFTTGTALPTGTRIVIKGGDFFVAYSNYEVNDYGYGFFDLRDEDSTVAVDIDWEYDETNPPHGDSVFTVQQDIPAGTPVCIYAVFRSRFLALADDNGPLRAVVTIETPTGVVVGNSVEIAFYEPS